MIPDVLEILGLRAVLAELEQQVDEIDHVDRAVLVDVRRFAAGDGGLPEAEPQILMSSQQAPNREANCEDVVVVLVGAGSPLRARTEVHNQRQDIRPIHDVVTVEVPGAVGRIITRPQVL